MSTHGMADWPAFIFDPAQGWLRRFQEIAERRFGYYRNRREDGARLPRKILAEEAVTAVIEQLSANDWAVLRTYSGLCSPGRFLMIAFQSHLEDFARSRLGRRRPPRWLARLGTFWVRVFELLCLDRESPEQVVALLCARPDTRVRPDEVRAAAEEIKRRVVDCGATQAEVRLDQPADEAGDRPAVDLPDTRSDPAARLDRDDWEALLHVLRRLMESAPGGPGAHAQTKLGVIGQPPWAALGHEVALTDDERLMLRLVYQESLSVTAAARTLGWSEQNFRRALLRLQQRLHQVLVRTGITAEWLHDTLHQLDYEDPLPS